MKYWEIIANRLHAQGWSYGIAEHFTKHGFLFCVDAHRDGKRFIVKADDLLTAFLSLERDTIAAKGANGNATVETYGGLHFAFNNAGILPATALLANVDEAAFDRVVAVDLKGVFLAMEYEIQYML